MFSLGWMEISIILIITIVVVGPKEIPTVIRFIKGMTSGIRKMSKEFTSTVDELTNLDEVKDIKKEILDTKESIIKDGKELDEFIDKSNKEIMDEKNNKHHIHSKVMGNFLPPAASSVSVTLDEEHVFIFPR